MDSLTACQGDVFPEAPFLALGRSTFCYKQSFCVKTFIDVLHRKTVGWSYRNSDGEATQLQRKLVGLLQAFCLTAPKEVGAGDSQQYPLMWSWMLRPYHFLLCLGYRLIQGVHPHSRLPPCTRHSVLRLSLFCKCPVSSPAASLCRGCLCPHFMSERTTERSKALCRRENRSSLICLSFSLFLTILGLQSSPCDRYHHAWYQTCPLILTVARCLGALISV